MSKPSHDCSRTLRDPGNQKAGVALHIYWLFQSAPKIHRLFKNSPRLRDFLIVEPQFGNLALVPSPVDQAHIGAMLVTNRDGNKLHAVLNDLRPNDPTDSRRWLPAFHHFFIWFLGLVRQQIEQLRDLRASKSAPSGLSKTFVSNAFNNLACMRYFAWDSGFFALYITAAFPPYRPSESSKHALRTDIAQSDHGGDDVPFQDEAGEWGRTWDTTFGLNLRQVKTNHLPPGPGLGSTPAYGSCASLPLTSSTYMHWSAVRQSPGSGFKLFSTRPQASR